MQKPFHGAVGPRIPGKFKEITYFCQKKKRLSELILWVT